MAQDKRFVPHPGQIDGSLDIARCYGIAVYQSREAAYGQGYLTADALAAIPGVECSSVLKRISSEQIGWGSVKRLPHSRV